MAAGAAAAEARDMVTAVRRRREQARAAGSPGRAPGREASAPLPDRLPHPGDPAGRILRLQEDAGNRAVNVLMRSALHREARAAPAKEQTQAGATVTLEGLGSFVALSVQFSRRRGIGEAGRDEAHSDIIVTKALDELSPKIAEAVSRGTRFPTVTIAMRGATKC